jgi:hypothetical protein
MWFDFVFKSSSSISLYFRVQNQQIAFTMESNPSKGKLELNKLSKEVVEKVLYVKR